MNWQRCKERVRAMNENKIRAMDVIAVLMYVEGISLEEIAQRVSKQGNIGESVQSILDEMQRKAEVKEG
jgi:hypothetical protein